MNYTATITSASLRLRESSIIADLLLQGVSKEEWNQAIKGDNILQMSSPESIRRISGFMLIIATALFFSVSWQLIWPLFLILIGMSIIVGRGSFTTAAN